MSEKTQAGSELDPNEQGVDELAEQLHAQERVRRKRTLVIAVAVIVATVGAFWWMAENTDKLFRPDVDPERAKETRMERTGDPVCRAIIHTLEATSADYEELELDYAEYVWGDDKDKLEKLREKSQHFRIRFREVKDALDEARFRAEHAPGDPPYDEQLAEWLGNMDNEFRIFEEMADKRLRMLADEEVAERGGLWEDPPELRDTVLMTVEENFHEFRVWLVRGGDPCDAPPEGVEAWDPEVDEPEMMVPL